MKLRKVIGTLLVLGALEGCKEVPGKCAQDTDCGQNQFCHPQVNQCFDQHYTGLNIETPVAHTVVGGGPVTVRARLEVNPAARPSYPAQLSFTATRVGDASSTELTLQGAENGTYTAVWTPPTTEGEYLIRATLPEAGEVNASVQVTVDRTAPSLVVQVPSAQSPAPADGFSYSDPKATATTPAWRRDQTVTVRVESDSTDLAPASLHVVVRGHKGGADVTDLALTPVTPCDGKTYCGTVEVPLWRPGLPDFRGEFLVEVTANDAVGNVRQNSAPIPVTRWKWAFDGASGAIRVTPAIGDKGTIYFGTSDANGKVFALEPNGTKKWEKQLGSVLGSPTVGKNPDGTDRLYVAPGTGTLATIYALDANGTPLATCPVPGGALGIVTSSLALTHQYIKSLDATFEAAISVHNKDDGGLVYFRPDVPSGVNQCSGPSLLFTEPQGASVVVQGNDYFFSAPRSTNPTAWNFRFNSETGSWEFPQTYDALSMGAPVTGMGVAEGGTLVAAGGLRSPTGTTRGGILAMYQLPSGVKKWQFPSDPAGSEPVRNLVIGAGNVVIFGRDLPEGAAELTAINLMAPSDEAALRATAPNAGSFPGAPVLGASGNLYTASFTGPEAGLGEVSAWSASDLRLRWKLSDSVGPAEASPSLDCTRATDGSPAAAPHGVLYVPSLDGRLYAFVVDSPGLDTSAPWPKYQRDARNTGNPETPITNCR